MKNSDKFFSKTKATQLPPHQTWDCAIDLLPNAMPPKSKVYPLSRNETQAMEEYMEEAMNSGFIHPSTSPAAVGFLFVEKNDGGLCPCIDYRGLNNMTVKFRNPFHWFLQQWNNYVRLGSPGTSQNIRIFTFEFQ